MTHSSANTTEPLVKSPADTAANAEEIILWDLPVRIVHWGFALLIPAMWATAEFGQMSAHRVIGFVLLGLLLFRIYWGVVGSSTARFTSFIRGPGAILRYLRGTEMSIGHNPLGALSVVSLLALLGLQLGLGLISQDTDALYSGPLTRLIAYETSDAATAWHGTIFWVLVLFVAIHIAAILFYAFAKRDNLVSPMVSGRKRLTVAQPQLAPLTRALIGAILSTAITYWIATGAYL